VELAAPFIHSLFCVIANTCLIDLYPSSTVGLCLMIYKLERSSDHRFRAKHSSSSPSENSELKPPNAFGIPNCVTLPCLQNSSRGNPILPRKSKMPPVVWYGYFLEIPLKSNLLWKMASRLVFLLCEGPSTAMLAAMQEGFATLPGIWLMPFPRLLSWLRPT